jgi:hypothetical protein
MPIFDTVQGESINQLTKSASSAKMDSIHSTKVKLTVLNAFPMPSARMDSKLFLTQAIGGKMSMLPVSSCATMKMLVYQATKLNAKKATPTTYATHAHLTTARTTPGKALLPAKFVLTTPLMPGECPESRF